MQTVKQCVIDIGRKNVDMPTSTVLGLVTLSQEEFGNSSCTQMKEVTVFNGEGNEMFIQSIKIINA